MSQKSVAVVTGASSGIGKAIAQQLLADGFIVYAAARRIEKMNDLQQSGAHLLKMDITKDDDVTRAVAEIQKEHNGVDVLVNNAGFGMYGAMEDTSIDDAKYQFEVNVFGPGRVTKAVLPYMRSKKSGTIINISSMGGKIYTPLGSWYHASKHAVEGWSDCLRFELAPFGINVVVIEPGIIETEFGDTMIAPMMERSGNSAYAEMTRKMKTATEKSYEKGNGSPPAVVAQTVSKALKSRKPKTRYAVGKMAQPLISLRKWLSDRMFDKIVQSSI